MMKTIKQAKSSKVLVFTFVLILLLSLAIYPVSHSKPRFHATFGLDTVSLTSVETGELLGMPVRFGGIPGVWVDYREWLIIAHVNEYTHKLSQKTKPITHVNKDGVTITVDPTPVMTGPILILPKDMTGHQEHPLEIYQIILDFKLRMDNPFTRRTAIEV